LLVFTVLVFAVLRYTLVKLHGKNGFAETSKNLAG